MSADIVDAVDGWIADNPERGTATWVRNRERPLRWLADNDPERTWQPTTLAKEIVEQATGNRMDAIPGGDVWHYNEQSLYALAKSIDTELTSG